MLKLKKFIGQNDSVAEWEERAKKRKEFINSVFMGWRSPVFQGTQPLGKV
ncbi:MULTISPECIES: hypothetical protein [Okeania]|nr:MULTISPECIES: hypothetical protein [Okeania]NET14653.1 hypothetical protein [Okeania sp. SIO1H6]NES76028.1 hypothetical protein [Okeania sp. SIO1H4]NES88109.1 hypothetical protein [Okeania sp. SIO2B9]NET19518.1 hypothetical protein [Okeania sp. SIO1H5]NET76504.1 hypothetical protein [Okeania sp. SIO1F9]